MDQKNFIVAIVVSVVIIMGWQHFFPAKTPPQQQQTTQTATPATPGSAGNAPGVPSSGTTTPPAEKVLTLDEALAAQGVEPADNQDVKAFLTHERDAFGRAVHTLGITVGQ